MWLGSKPWLDIRGFLAGPRKAESGLTAEAAGSAQLPGAGKETEGDCGGCSEALSRSASAAAIGDAFAAAVAPAAAANTGCPGTDATCTPRNQ